MTCRWLTLACLLSTWAVTQGYVFWPALFQRQTGFYDDPCGTTLYRMRAEGVRDLPNSIYIPPPRRPRGRGQPAPPRQRPQPPPPPQQEPQPPPTKPRPAGSAQPAAPAGPRYPTILGPYGRPLDPWLLLALDIDPLEGLPDATTVAPSAPQAPQGSSAPRRRVQRQAPSLGPGVAVPQQAAPAGPAAPAAPAVPAIQPAPRPVAPRPAAARPAAARPAAARPAAARPAAPRPAARPAAVDLPPTGVQRRGNFRHRECYCDSHWDCNGPARAAGGRYDPQCDSGYGLVCCCR